MLRAFLCAAAVVAGLSGPVSAQTPAQSSEQTLADIRQELTVLFVEVQRLKTQLSTTGAPTTSVGGTTVLTRLDSIEQVMQGLIAKTEALEFRVERVVTDGTNKIGDLEFRLCELEADCDIATLGDTPRLGGATDTGTPAPAAPAPAPDTTGEQFAIGEQGDFDRARALFDEGRFAEAAESFEAFTQDYFGGPLSVQAHMLRGQALIQVDQPQPAARAFLEAFTLAPNGPAAPGALVRLGRALGALDQLGEACLTLSEVGVRFPDAVEVSEAEAARVELSCQ